MIVRGADRRNYANPIGGARKPAAYSRPTGAPPIAVQLAGQIRTGSGMMFAPPAASPVRVPRLAPVWTSAQACNLVRGALAAWLSCPVQFRPGDWPAPRFLTRWLPEDISVDVVRETLEFLVVAGDFLAKRNSAGELAGVVLPDGRVFAAPRAWLDATPLAAARATPK